MKNNIVIKDKKRLEELKKLIAKGGVKNLHILADFDRTITRAFVNGKYVPSLTSILRDGNYLTPEYAKKAHELFNKYHPIEINPNIPIKRKKKAMDEWWMLHLKLLIKYKLNKKDIESMIKSSKLKLRKGFRTFVNILKSDNIPLVIMSASGLGKEAIKMYLKKEKINYKNIHIIGNSYKWNRRGTAISIEKPIIHVLKKDETIIHNFPVFKTIKNRKNVILFGDSIGDIGMISGFNYKTLIKIGFLNEKVKENLNAYKKIYDVIILNDSPMNFINQLLKNII